ncbi:MAG: histidine triad nucleotide-binding protein [Opitutales bacterium]
MITKSIFEKIIDREIPAKILFEDELCIAIEDIEPQAPIHILIIPKKKIARIELADEADAPILGHLLLTARKLAKLQNLDAGFRIVINNGSDGGESVPHLHVHLLGGRQMKWPPG